jgi:regulator of sigma E protease
MNLETILQYPVGLILGIIAFVAVFIPPVCIHEFGHLIFAKLCGVRVPEFAVGLPFSKRLAFVRKFGIIWSFYPVLLGGFVRLYGDSDSVDNAHEKNETNPAEAREQYRQNRLDEILATYSLQFFLEDNHIEYDEKWKEFENYRFEPNKEVPKNIKKLQDQLFTLIDWEWDREKNAKDTFFSKNWLQKTVIILGGITFNLITAILCYSAIFGFASGGKISLPLSQISNFEQKANIKSVSDYSNFVALKGGVAEKNDIITGDKLYSIGGKKLKEFGDTKQLSDFLQTKKNEEVEITFSKKDSDVIQTKKVILEEREVENGEKKVLFGIQGDLFHDIKYESKGIIPTLTFGVESTRNMIELNFIFLEKIGKALLPQTEDRSALKYLGGPVGTSNKVVDIFKKLRSDEWLSYYLQILASISISLAIFNLLPIPALDGGRWIVITVTKILGRRNRKIENMVIGYSFMFMMGLGILIMFKDSWEILFK